MYLITVQNTYSSFRLTNNEVLLLRVSQLRFIGSNFGSMYLWHNYNLAILFGIKRNMGEQTLPRDFAIMKQLIVYVHFGVIWL